MLFFFFPNNTKWFVCYGLTYCENILQIRLHEFTYQVYTPRPLADGDSPAKNIRPWDNPKGIAEIPTGNPSSRALILLFFFLFFFLLLPRPLRWLLSSLRKVALLVSLDVIHSVFSLFDQGSSIITKLLSVL